MFALKLQGSFNFTCVSPTLEGTKKKVHIAYADWNGLSPRGAPRSYAEFMEHRVIVEVTVKAAT